MQTPQQTQRQGSQLSLALGSTFPALKWELRDFPRCPGAWQGHRCQWSLPSHPTSPQQTVSPGWTPSEPRRHRLQGETGTQRQKKTLKVTPGEHSCPLPCAAGQSEQGRRCRGAGSGAQWPATSVPQAAWIPTWWWASRGAPGPL